jgi:hypothetical protein
VYPFLHESVIENQKNPEGHWLLTGTWKESKELETIGIKNLQEEADW